MPTVTTDPRSSLLPPAQADKIVAKTTAVAVAVKPMDLVFM
jgi:hypothetical protein